MLSSKLLLGIVLALAALALTAPLYLLLLARYPLVAIQGHWSLGGVYIDTTDLLLGFLFVGFILRGRRAAWDERPTLHYLYLWLALGLLLTLSYLNAPAAQEYLTAAHRVGYQVYRYCWKTILFFPIVLLLVDRRVRVERALLAVVLAGDILAVEGTIQGYFEGGRATGPFRTGNELAGALVAPLLISLIGFVAPQVRFRPFWLVSSILMLRALLFTGSRGGIVAAAAGITFCGLWLLTSPAGRTRLARLAPVALVTAILVLWIKPDLLERPTIRRALSAREGMGAHTMQWRVQRRWPVFLETVRENPWLGVGTAVDSELAEQGRGATPHNGYLALATAHGIPVTLLYVLMALLALKNTLLVFVRSDDPWESAWGLVLASALAGVLVHNIVEATLRSGFVRDIFWLICALSARRALSLTPERQPAVHRAPPRAMVSGVAR